MLLGQPTISSGYKPDPNKPGVGQTIEYANERFKPYIAMLNGNAASNPYPFVTYYAKTAYIEWNKIGKRYAKLLDNSIGNVAPNKFPDYTIWVKGKEDRKMVDGFSIDSDTLRCTIECPGAPGEFRNLSLPQVWRTSCLQPRNTAHLELAPRGMHAPLEPGHKKIYW